MKLCTRSFNQKKDIDDYVNARGITRDKLVSVYQDMDRTYVLVYYED